MTGVGDLRVVVVDDDDDQRLVVRRLLARAGITDVHEAVDGDAALEVVGRVGADLVVLDLAMPGRSGSDVLPELHRLARGAPIVVLSNLSRRRWEPQVVAGGAVGFVEKSTPTAQLVDDLLTTAALIGALGTRLSLDLERDPASPAAARRFARSVVADIEADADLRDAVELLVSELITNAVVHAASAPCLSVVLAPGSVRVEVHDDDPSPPNRREPDADRPGGRGLLLLEQLASDWGWRPDGGGKVVWFELERPG